MLWDHSSSKVSFENGCDRNDLILTFQTVNSSAFSGLKHVKFLFLPAGVRNLESDAFNGLEFVDKLKLAYLVSERSSCIIIKFSNQRL